ncbi:MAG: PAS domain-containing protein [Chloroflexales bacterium]|nr:PAS domain-containing protein [Chloroflexales bacterium]
MSDDLPPAFATLEHPTGQALGDELPEALEGSRVAVALVDCQLRYIWAVNMARVCAGDTLIGKTDRELYGLAGDGLMALKSRALATGLEIRDEVCLPVGSQDRFYELTVTPRRDGAGTVTGLRCVMIEITARLHTEMGLARLNADLEGRVTERTAVLVYTIERLEREVAERRRAEDRLSAMNVDLQRSRDLLRTLFDGIDDALLLLDRSGTILAANQRFAALSGASASELVGCHWWAHCATTGAAFPQEMIQASLEDGLARGERVRFSMPDGVVHILDMHTLPLVEDGRYLEQLVVHLRDVTDQMQLEAQMIETERFAANQRLAATVAHEVNTPLQAIESCLHLASKLADEERRTRYLSLARDEIKRIGHILRQLLDLYRPSKSAAPIALNDLVERVLLLVGSSLSRQGISVERELSPGLPTLTGRADELTQVLVNLIFNAKQAMGRGGHLTLRTSYEEAERPGPRLVLTVRDSGPGIEGDLLGRIFEPFFTTRPDGSGLGLAVSQRIVAAHGGTITVESTPGAGACFAVVLPLERDGATPGAGV